MPCAATCARSWTSTRSWRSEGIYSARRPRQGCRDDRSSSVKSHSGHFPLNRAAHRGSGAKTGGKCAKPEVPTPRLCACGNPVAPWISKTCVECNKAASKKHYQKTKVRQNARRAEWYRKNTERAREYARTRRRENPPPRKPRNVCPCGNDAAFSEKCVKCRREDPQHKAYKKAYRKKVQARINAYAQKRRAEVPAWYARTLLTSYRTNLKPSELPEPLVQLYRANLFLKRLCKLQKTSKR